MKTSVLIIAAALGLYSCSPRIYPAQRDTLTVIREKVVEKLVTDTVTVELPQDSTAVQTRDTSSVLRIRAAISEASVSGGKLHHSLYSDPAYRPEIVVQWRDRIEYRDTVITSSQTEIVEVSHELTPWQDYLIATGYVTTVGAVLLIVIGVVRLIRRIKGI